MKKLGFLSLVLFLMAPLFMFISCEKDIVPTIEEEPDMLFAFTEALTTDRTAEESSDCYTFVYPISVILPNGSTVTLNSDADWLNIREWYSANPNVEEKPAFVFPLQIQYEGREAITINNSLEMREVEAVCAAKEEKACYELIYPVTYIMPDGSEISGEDKRTLDEAIRAWYEDHPNTEGRPSIKFPAQIQFEGREPFTVNNAEEMSGIEERCKEGKEDGEVDCPEQRANIGDDCRYQDANGAWLAGKLNERCECGETTYDCPDLEANVGDDCRLADGTLGKVTANCGCE